MALAAKLPLQVCQYIQYKLTPAEPTAILLQTRLSLARMEMV
jgi:hypothetical protein